MKRSREESDEEESPASKKEVRELKDLLAKALETSNSIKRTKTQPDPQSDDEEEEDQPSDSLFSLLTSLVKPAPVKTEAIIARQWGNKIMNGEIKISHLPYDDAGTLTEYTFFISYPNSFDGSNVHSLSTKIPWFYRTILDLQDCQAGRMRFRVQQCRSQKLVRILNREQLKTTGEKPLPLQESGDKSTDDHYRELTKRIGKIFSIPQVQPSELMTDMVKRIKNLDFGVIQRNVNPPITNSDITAAVDVPLVHSVRFQPEKNRLGIRLITEIQKI